MKEARRFAEIVLERAPEAEFIIDLGRNDSTLELVATAFQELGCSVERDGKPGRLIIRNGHLDGKADHQA